jgi:hypothetical protein
VLYSGRAVRSGWQSRLFPATGPTARLLVRRDDEFIMSQRSAFPNAVVEIEDGVGFGRKVGIAPQDPASRLPGAKAIPAEPAPQGGAADLGHETLQDHLLPQSVCRRSSENAFEWFHGTGIRCDVSPSEQRVPIRHAGGRRLYQEDSGRMFGRWMAEQERLIGHG